MRRHLPMFYSALLLTFVNLLLRMVGTSFQVYLSGHIGAAGIGLLQLVMSVGSLAMVTGMAGIRTATMYLTAESLGKKKPGQVVWVLSGCFCYSMLFSGTVAAFLYRFAPWIAEFWIRDIRTAQALKLFAAFLPATCLCGVMTGYFTAANRIGTLAAVEVAEQLCSMAITMIALHFWAGADSSKACLCVILGSGMGGILTLLCLIILRLLEHPPRSHSIPIYRPLADAALPLAAADILKSGINTMENLMVPRRLRLNTAVADPLAAFGTLSGMVFPMLMFPACILFGLAELLIPELARCRAAGSHVRIRYLTRRGLGLAMLYGAVFSGALFLLSEPLCIRFYSSAEAGRYLKLYAMLVPILYCDAITDAMTKGLGQQKICVRYNILTSAMDVIFLFFLLPRHGMMGYFFSFTVTHLLNFALSLRLLLKITGEKLSANKPLLTLAGLAAAIYAAAFLTVPVMRLAAYIVVLCCVWCLLGVIHLSDLNWLKGLVFQKSIGVHAPIPK